MYRILQALEYCRNVDAETQSGQWWTRDDWKILEKRRNNGRTNRRGGMGGKEETSDRMVKRDGYSCLIFVVSKA